MAALGQAIRYCIVGLFSAALNYVMFISGIAAGLHYLVAATVSSAVTLVTGYFLHRTFTFSASGVANVKEFASFLGVFGVQYLLAMTGYMLLIGHLGLSPTLAFILNNIVVASVAFSIMRYRTFRAAHR